MKRIRLTHFSRLAGAEGNPGTIIDVDDELAEKWSADGGCVVLGEAEAAPTKKRTAAKDKPEVER